MDPEFWNSSKLTVSGQALAASGPVLYAVYRDTSFGKVWKAQAFARPPGCLTVSCHVSELRPRSSFKAGRASSLCAGPADTFFVADGRSVRRFVRGKVQATLDSQLKAPTSLAVDAMDGLIFVGSPGSGTVAVLDAKNGTARGAIDTKGSSVSVLSAAAGQLFVAVDGDVRKFDVASGADLGEAFTVRTGVLSLVVDVAFTSQGRAFVADPGALRVAHVSREGDVRPFEHVFQVKAIAIIGDSFVAAIANDVDVLVFAMDGRMVRSVTLAAQPVDIVAVGVSSFAVLDVAGDVTLYGCP